MSDQQHDGAAARRHHDHHDHQLAAQLASVRLDGPNPAEAHLPRQDSSSASASSSAPPQQTATALQPTTADAAAATATAAAAARGDGGGGGDASQLPHQQQDQQSSPAASPLLALPHDIRLLIWEEAVGGRYMHLALSHGRRLSDQHHYHHHHHHQHDQQGQQPRHQHGPGGESMMGSGGDGGGGGQLHHHHHQQQQLQQHHLLQQQQHHLDQRQRVYGSVGSLECSYLCYHCTHLAEADFADFEIRPRPRRIVRPAGTGVGGLVSVASGAGGGGGAGSSSSAAAAGGGDTRGVLALLLTCRLVYDEAIDFLYKSNTFQFTSPRTLTRLYEHVRPRRWDSIRTLHLHWSFRAPLFSQYHHLISQHSAQAGAAADAAADDDAASLLDYYPGDVADDDPDILELVEEDAALHQQQQQQQEAPQQWPLPAGIQADGGRSAYDPTLDSMLYWQHPLLESMPSMEIDRAHWEWEHWRGACAAVASMRGLRDFRLCLRTGLVAAPGQMVLFLSPLRGLRLPGGGGGARGVSSGGVGVSSSGGSGGGGGGDDGRAAQGEAGRGGQGEDARGAAPDNRWRLGLLCLDSDAWAVQQALNAAGFECQVSRLIAEYLRPGLSVQPPVNVQYRR